MEDDIIKIVYLPPLRVASFHAMGKGIGDPETKVGKNSRVGQKIEIYLMILQSIKCTDLIILPLFILMRENHTDMNYG